MGKFHKSRISVTGRLRERADFDSDPRRNRGIRRKARQNRAVVTRQTQKKANARPSGRAFCCIQPMKTQYCVCNAVYSVFPITSLSGSGKKSCRFLYGIVGCASLVFADLGQRALVSRESGIDVPHLAVDLDDASKRNAAVFRHNRDAVAAALE